MASYLTKFVVARPLRTKTSRKILDARNLPHFSNNLGSFEVHEKINSRAIIQGNNRNSFRNILFANGHLFWNEFLVLGI